MILSLTLGALLTCGAPLPATQGAGSPAPDPPHPFESQQSPSALVASTYYVRPDGGSPEQCTGLADAAYPGSGSSQPCAWDHLFRALPPGGTPRINGGDTLMVATGSYMMGYGAPGADTCETDYPWDCHMPPIPSGPDASHPTRVLGNGWNTACPQPPTLWGTERVDYVLNLIGASNVEIACLELTDHSSCVEDHSGGLACNRDTYPFGPWAPIGIQAQDSTNVQLRNLNIHGFAHTGIHAGRLTDWTLEKVRIAGNGWIGWDGDLDDDDDSNSGTLLFRHWTVEWNGCGETYPGGQPTGCWGQTAGGYGDGVGTGATQGHWIIEDSTFSHNTSDGLDLLYARPGSSIEIRRTAAFGNAGDQIKTNGPTSLENVISASNCGFFENKAFTHHVDNCRAGGSALAFTLWQSDRVTVTNTTITGQGDCLIIAECAENGQCDGSESVLLRNNILLGNPEFGQSEEVTCLTWYGDSGLPSDPFDVDYSVITGTKNIPPCPGSHDKCEVSPGLLSPSIDAFDAHLRPDSPAIDAGDNSFCPAVDYAGMTRPLDGDDNGSAVCDVGAYEWWKPVAWVYLPVVVKG